MLCITALKHTGSIQIEIKCLDYCIQNSHDKNTVATATTSVKVHSEKGTKQSYQITTTNNKFHFLTLVQISPAKSVKQNGQSVNITIAMY